MSIALPTGTYTFVTAPSTASSAFLSKLRGAFTGTALSTSFTSATFSDAYTTPVRLLSSAVKLYVKVPSPLRISLAFTVTFVTNASFHASASFVTFACTENATVQSDCIKSVTVPLTVTLPSS